VAERRPYKADVAGSTPVPPTNGFSTVRLTTMLERLTRGLKMAKNADPWPPYSPDFSPPSPRELQPGLAAALAAHEPRGGEGGRRHARVATTHLGQVARSGRIL
jgi:hypothetical protein